VVCLYIVSAPTNPHEKETEIMHNARENYETIADDTVPLKDRDRSLSMIVVVVCDKVLVRHAILLLDVYRRLHHFSKAGRVRITCLKCFGHHVVFRRGLMFDG
jgi:hypothetical protein